MAHKNRPSGDKSSVGRRQYLKYATAATAATGMLAGCTGGNGNGNGNGESGGEGETGDEHENTGGEDDHDEELPEGVSEEEFISGPVPDVYMTATSLGGEERHPEELSTKAEVTFSEYDEALENEAHVAGTCCGNCGDFIADKNGDGFGACAEVEGYIANEDWCTIYDELPEPEVPEGMSEDELATAEVPEEYRTATSQGNEERNPDELSSQEEVELTESVEAIAEGTAPPGQSCGTCADFIPDKNGDTWGACAVVEGYIAVEDWCLRYESITEGL